jgi:hypothetical protein
MPRRKELTPYRDLAAYALKEYGIDRHPSWLQACEIIEGWIARHEAMPEPYRKHFRRLYEGGANGPAMLLNILSVYGLREVGVPDSYTDDSVFFTCLGSRFLRTVSLGGFTRDDGRRVSPELPGLTCEALGRALAERVGVFALTFWKRVEREKSWREASLREMEKAVQDLKRQGTPSTT